MPTKTIQNIGTAGATLFTTPKHVVGKVTSVNIDNKGAEVTITMQDMFSGDVSNGVSAPTANSGVLLQVTLLSGESLHLTKDSLEDIRTFGIVNAYGSVSGNYTMTVAYHFE